MRLSGCADWFGLSLFGTFDTRRENSLVLKMHRIMTMHRAFSEDSDQTARMRRLIWVFAEHSCPTVHLFKLQLKCADWSWSFWYHMGQRLREEILENMRTPKIQTILRILAVWSVYLLFAYTRKGPCWKHRTNSEDFNPTRGCANRSGASPFVYALRLFCEPAGHYEKRSIFVLRVSIYSCVYKHEKWHQLFVMVL